MISIKIKKKKDYQFIFKYGKKINGRNFNLQYLETENSYARMGITASKKLGNAVKRNYIKRRIRSLLTRILSNTYINIKDYVIVAKKGVLSEKFKALQKELMIMFKKVKKENE